MKLFVLLSLSCSTLIIPQNFTTVEGGIIRGNKDKKEIALVFTGDSYSEGGEYIKNILDKHKIKGSFFFTGNFYRNPYFKNLIITLKQSGHYLGAHSDKHLLYCSWENRESLLITKEEFVTDIMNNYNEMKKFDITKEEAKYFIPPYEWYNKTISEWASESGIILIKFSPGTKSNADYTTPDMNNYVTSEDIYQNILDYENSHNLNGFILLSHIGTAPERKDKFYFMLDDLISELMKRGYSFKRIDDLLNVIR
jgi:peptidoglycan/xylan/chitin deacetylase (PgdA/CDA1 family)